MRPAIVVHGGAGAWELRGPRIVEAQAACAEAARAGQSVLLDGGTAIDAAETSVRILEDCPILDAGRGSYLNAAGEIEMDALIMDGRSLDIGAVGAVQLIKNPISLARRVLTDTEHKFLVGRGAERFADSIDFPRCTFEQLLSEEELAQHFALREKSDYNTGDIFSEPGAMGDTVGAVAIDQQGDLAAAVSTGGTRRKLPGRIGDSPLVGSGAYADNWTAAACATGHGESLMKVVISKRVCDFVGMGMSAEAACRAAINVLVERVSGLGGLIAVDARGRIGVAYNTAAMPHASAIGDGEVISGR